MCVELTPTDAWFDVAAVHFTLVCVVSGGGAGGTGWKPADFGQCPDTLRNCVAATVPVPTRL